MTRKGRGRARSGHSSRRATSGGPAGDDRTAPVFATYNICYMDHLFVGNTATPWTDKNTVPHSGDRNEQAAYKKFQTSRAIATVIRTIDPEILGICEAPRTQDKLEKWVDAFLGPGTYNVLMATGGYLSRGNQQIAVLYKPRRYRLLFKPGRTFPFDQEARTDADEDLVYEIYKLYRPPLEVQILDGTTGNEAARLIQAHPKSKGIFNAVDMVHYERVSRQNQLKLYAESILIRRRIDQWLKEKRNVIVMGDFNDGPEMDFVEQQYRKSSLEMVMGTIWDPPGILNDVIGAPKWGKYGYKPATTRFKDRFTEDNIDVLIDHILLSQSLGHSNGFVWNPYQYARDINKRTKSDKAFMAALKAASDHFPVSVEIEIPS